MPKEQCQIQFLTEPVITFGTAIAAFYIPVSVMTILYCRIYKETQRRTKDLAELQGLATENIPEGIKPPKTLNDNLEKFQRAFYYTEEGLREHLKPMAMQGQEPVGAMGNDAPLAILSAKPFI